MAIKNLPTTCHHADGDLCHLCVKFKAATAEELMQALPLSADDAKRIAESSISLEVAVARGYRTVTNADELRDVGFADYQAALVPSLLIPIQTTRGKLELHQIRPVNPRPKRNDAKEIIPGKYLKYETPAGASMVLDVHPHTVQWIRDGRRIKVFTEGSRKVDAAVSRGLCCIGLLGVHNINGTNEFNSSTILPDFNDIAFKYKDRDGTEGRCVVLIAFDSDVMKKEAVYFALRNLADYLRRRGADVYFIYLPDRCDEKGGLDDAFADGLTVDQLLSKAIKELCVPPTIPHAADIDAAKDLIRSVISAGTDAIQRDVFTDAFMGSCALVKDLDKTFWGQVAGAVKSAKVNMTDFHGAVKQTQEKRRRHLRSVKPDEVSHGEKPIGVPMRLALRDDALPDYRVPPGFVLRMDAICTKRETEMGDIVEPFAGCPAYIHGRLENIDSHDVELILKWKRPSSNSWSTKVVSRKQVMTAQEIVKLSGSDFPVKSTNKEKVIDFLDEFESVNYAEIIRSYSTGRLGWHTVDGARVYLAGSTLITEDGAISDHGADADAAEIGPLVFRAPEGGEAQAAESLRRHGDFEAWKSAISKIQHLPLAMVGVYAALVPPLLNVLREHGEDPESFIVSFAGESTGGKTTTLKVSASLWGKPTTTDSGFVGSWKSTGVGLERRAVLFNDLPVLMDETQHAEKPDDVVKGIYLYSGGQGKGRGKPGGLARTGFWRSVMLMTGEQPATSFTKDGGNGGTKVRVIEMAGDPFGTDSSATRALIADVSQQLLLNFGHAGPEFVSRLMRERGEWKSLVTAYRTISASLAKGGSRGAGRLAKHAALIELAAMLAHRHKIIPGEYQTVFQGKSLWSEVTQEADDACGAEESLDDFFNRCTEKRSQFFSDGEAHNPHSTNKDILGRWDRQNWEFIGVLKSTFKDIVKKGMGMSPTTVLRMWKKREWIRTGRKGYDYPIRFPDGQHRRVVYIHRAAIEAAVNKPDPDADLS